MHALLARPFYTLLDPILPLFDHKTAREKAECAANKVLRCFFLRFVCLYVGMLGKSEQVGCSENPSKVRLWSSAVVFLCLSVEGYYIRVCECAPACIMRMRSWAGDARDRVYYWNNMVVYGGRLIV